MKRFVLLLLLALWLLSSSSFADQVVVPSAEVLPVFDAKYGASLSKPLSMIVATWAAKLVSTPKTLI